ncbi:MAG: bile acid:sodium symporter family protein [Sandaracinus sp.]|nr:bile acid:sodium symporter family protein [Sandaracinus sp.]MCB9622670.1 bile acid:sodium symporter family protein [Sandaracinus sp.]MCB9632948.1 bile acid:sodium symporter family protein [Sandaracinus sp.]
MQAFAEQFLVPLQLVLAMLGMGATLRVSDFAQVARHPTGVALGLALQLGMVPLLGVALTALYGLGPGFAVGMLLIASVPGGAISNLLTFLGRGNVPLSIAVTITSTFGCALTAPVLLRLFASEYLPAEFALPVARLAMEIGLYLIAPLLLGMVVQRFVPKHAQAVCDWSVRLSLVVIVIIATSSLGTGRIKPFDYGVVPLLAVATYATLHAYGTPHLLRLLGRDDGDSVALSVEVTVRNSSIALLLVNRFFPGQPEQAQVLYVCLLYAGVATPIVLPLLFLHRRGVAPALGRRPRPAPQPQP